MKNSQFFTLFPTVCSDLSYLEVKFFDLLIGSRDFEHVSRDVPTTSGRVAGVELVVPLIVSINQY